MASALQLCMSLPGASPPLTRVSAIPRRRVLRPVRSLESCDGTAVKLESGSWVPSSSRRLALCLVLISAFVTEGPAQARGRRKKNISVEDYQTSGDGLQFYDIAEGKGPTADIGSTVVVHFDCIYRSLTVVSSRESKLLGGNRIIAEPYEFIVGSVPGKERKEAFVENANGLYSAQSAPKPPPALYTATAGMRVGGQRTVIVPPEVGYGKKGFAEIPSGATIELNIELLEVKKATEPSKRT